MSKQTKPIRRYGPTQWKGLPSPGGKYRWDLGDENIAMALGVLVVRFSHAEEHLIDILRILIGSEDSGVARQIFRSVAGDKARLEIIRGLLERTIRNAKRTRDFDDALKAFEVVKNKRNRFVHGLWTLIRPPTLSTLATI